MELNRKDFKKSGIYCIKNIINNKMYIGKSFDIYTRIACHKQGLNTKNKNENRHLINAWHKYGSENFIYEVLEYTEKDEQILYDKELYWITFYNTTNKEKGYNLRLDSLTKNIVHDETRKLLSQKNSGVNNPNYGNKWSEDQKKQMSEKIKKQFENNERKLLTKEDYVKIGKKVSEYWETHEFEKLQMIEKVRQKNTVYKICQYDKITKKLIKIWDCVNDIITENPHYKKHNIYAVCSGEKPTIYGYIWKKIIKDDIVQPDTKLSE